MSRPNHRRYLRALTPLANRAGWVCEPTLLLTAIIAVVFACTQPAGATTRFVNASAGAGGNGLSWATAYRHLQTALAAAGSGDQIWVAQGTYMPDGGYTPVSAAHVNGSGNRSATFQLINGVKIYGGFVGNTETMLSQRNIAANPTILSGDLAGNDGPDFANYGDNSYHVVTGSGTDATALLDGFTIQGGNAYTGTLDAQGGGITIINGSPIIARCTIAGNRGLQFGGGIYAENSGVIVTNCRFLGNLAGHLTNGGAFGWGGGMYNNDGSIAGKLTNCVFSGNTATGIGGGLFNSRQYAIANCSFNGNAALGTGQLGAAPEGTGGGVFTTGGAVHKNVVLWGNSAPNGGSQLYAYMTPLYMSYCDTQGGITAADHDAGTTLVLDHMLNADPLFRDPVAADLSLLPGSPCIDAGDNAAVPADAADLDGDANTAEPTPLDLAGYARFRDIPETADTGAGTPPIVDMGAYEAFTDCNNNGMPDDLDIALGTSQDANHDGVPDECTFWAATNNLWGTAGNWSPAVVPNNGGGQTYSAVISAANANVSLNINATVDSLRLTPTGPVSPVPILHIDSGDLTLATAAGIICNGDLTVGSGHAIIAAAPQDPIRMAGTMPIKLGGATARISSQQPSDPCRSSAVVSGQGVIDANFINDGTVRADVSGATLKVTGSNAKVNNNLFHATSGGTLLISDAVVQPGVPVVPNDPVRASYLAEGTGSVIRLLPGAALVEQASLPASMAQSLVRESLLARERIPATNGDEKGFSSQQFSSQQRVTVSTSIAGDSATATNNGIIEVGGDSAITLAGTLTLDGGTFQGISSPSATLSAADVVIQGNIPGHMKLSGSMGATVTNSVRVSSGCGHFLRGCIPPVFSCTGSSSLGVGGDLTFDGDVGIQVTSTQSVHVGGKLDNRATDASTYDWTTGSLTMDGAAAQTLEAAGLDMGPRNANGFVNNFAMGTLRIEPGRVVDVKNLFANQSAGCEVLYVSTLSLGAGCTLRLNGCNVYYATLVKESGATVVLLNGAALMSTNAGDLDNMGGVNSTDAVILANVLTGSDTNAGHVAAADLNGDGVVNGADIQWMVRMIFGY